MDLRSRVAVLIPCYNEARTIEKVIRDFQTVLPTAQIYVYDNHSEDNTAILAKNAGAFVKSVRMRGKGHVVRRMFADIDANVYIMVDGDATYDASIAPKALALLQDQMLDMLVAVRQPKEKTSFPIGHQWGNYWFNRTITFLFGTGFQDVFSGYRFFSRRFVKSFPAVSQGFEIEAEISIHALQLSVPVAEIETLYAERPEGSFSKLHTLRDGIRILHTIFRLFLYNKPILLFGSLFAFFVSLAFFLGIPVIWHYHQVGLVPRLPTAVLAASLALLGSLSLACGIVLDSISRVRLEAKRFWYLALSPNAG